MYNKDLKIRFIQCRNKSDSDDKICYLLFRRIEPFEREWNADICTVSVEKLQPVLEVICGNRTGSWSRLYILKSYCKWCLYEAKVPGACDSIFHIKLAGIEMIKNQMVASPRDLQRCLDRIYKCEDDNTVDNVYRCYFWMAFCGIPESNILNITSNDVDLTNMTIISDEVEYELYRESFASVRKCATIDSFALIHPLHNDVSFKPRGKGNQLLRGFKDLSSIYTLRSSISQDLNNNKSERAISYNRVWLSGVFYRIHEDEVVTGIPRFDGYLDDFMRGKDYKLGPGRSSLQTVRKEKLNIVSQSYNRWKIAFNY